MGFLGTLLNVGAAFATGGASSLWRAAAMAFMLVKDSPSQKGPRLGNLSITLDGEGQEIARGWGRWQQEMRLVYTSGLLEKKKTKKKGGFLGTSLGAAKVTTYKYGTRCVMIGGRGPITRVNHIKFNQYALYDYNGGDEEGGELVWNGQIWQGETKAGIKIRVYPGTLDQPVDPLLVEAKGENAWTNYPGKWLLALEIPDLEKYGNSMPRVSVEAQYDVSGLPAIIEEIGSWVGLEPEDFDLSALENLTISPGVDIKGFSVDSRRKAADIIGELMDLFHFSLPEVDGVLRAVLRPSGPVFSLGQDDLQVQAGYKSEKQTTSPLRLSDEESLSQIKEIVSRDPDRENAPGYRYARRTGLESAPGGTRRKTTFQTSASMSGPRASDLARVLLAEEWAGALGIKGTLGVEYLWLSAGDEGTVETEDGLKSVVLDDTSPPLFGPTEVNLLGLDPLVYNLPLRDETAGIERPTPIEKGIVIVFVGEIPIVAASGEIATERSLIYGVCRSIGDSDYDGADINLETRISGGEWRGRANFDYDDEAVIGELTTDWTPGSLDGEVTGEGFTCQVWGGALQSALVGSGANLIVFSNGLICTLETLHETASNPNSRYYHIDTLRTGVYGTDDLSLPLTAGTRFMLLQDERGEAASGSDFLPVPPLASGEQLRLRVHENGYETLAATWNVEPFIGENVRTPSPLVTATREADGALVLEGAGRTRFFDDMDLNAELAGPVYREKEFAQGFKFQITLAAAGQVASLVRYSTADLAAFEFAFSTAELMSLLGRTSPQIAVDDVDVQVALYGALTLGRAAHLTALAFGTPSDEDEDQSEDGESGSGGGLGGA